MLYKPSSKLQVTTQIGNRDVGCDGKSEIRNPKCAIRNSSLFDGGKNGRSVVGHADSHAGVWTKVREAFYPCKIKTEPRRPDLHSDSSFRLRFCPEWTSARSCIGSAVHFPCKTELVIETEDS